MSSNFENFSLLLSCVPKLLNAIQPDFGPEEEKKIATHNELKKFSCSQELYPEKLWI